MFKPLSLVSPRTGKSAMKSGNSPKRIKDDKIVRGIKAHDGARAKRGKPGEPGKPHFGIRADRRTA